MATSPSPLTQLQIPQKSTLAKVIPRTAPAPGGLPPRDIICQPGFHNEGGRCVPDTKAPTVRPPSGAAPSGGGGSQERFGEFGGFLNPNAQNLANAFPTLTLQQVQALQSNISQGMSTAQAAQKLGITLPTPVDITGQLAKERFALPESVDPNAPVDLGTPAVFSPTPIVPPPIPQPPNAPTTAPPFTNSQGQTIQPGGVNVAPGSVESFVNSQGQTITPSGVNVAPGITAPGGLGASIAPALQPPAPTPQPSTTGLVDRPIANQPPNLQNFMDLVQRTQAGDRDAIGELRRMMGDPSLPPFTIDSNGRFQLLSGGLGNFFGGGTQSGAGQTDSGAGSAGGLLDLLRQRFGGGGGGFQAQPTQPLGRPSQPVSAGTQQTPAGPFDQFSNPNFPSGPGFNGGGLGDFGFDQGGIQAQLAGIPDLAKMLRSGGNPALRNFIVSNLAGGSLGTDINQRLTSSLSDRLTRSPAAGFEDLPFSDQLSDIISQFGSQLGGPIQGQGEIGQLLSQLSGGNLPRSFQDTLEGLVGNLSQSGTNPFGPGLTREEAEAQRSILDTTLERARGRAFTDIKADAARRGLTSRDAPSQERLARLDEELARQAGTLANQQLLQDFDLRRSSGQLGLSRQQTLADIIGGTRAEDLGLADLLGRVGLGAGGQDRQFQLESLEGLGGLIGPERGLQAQQQSNLVDQISRLIQSEQQASLGQGEADLRQQALASDTDLRQQAIDRLNQGDLGSFFNLLFSGSGNNTGGGDTSGGGGDEGGGGFLDFLKRFVPNINIGGNTGPRIDNLGELPGADFNPRDLFNDPFTPQFIPQSPFDLNTGRGGGFDDFQFDTLNPRSSGFHGPGSAIFRSGIF